MIGDGIGPQSFVEEELTIFDNFESDMLRAPEAIVLHFALAEENFGKNEKQFSLCRVRNLDISIALYLPLSIH